MTRKRTFFFGLRNSSSGSWKVSGKLNELLPTATSTTSELLRMRYILAFQKWLMKWDLSLGHTDSQVVASSGKLNFRRDLRWVAKRTDKFPHNYAQVANKLISRQTCPIFSWLIIGYWTSLNLRWLGLDGQTVKPYFDLRANLISTKVSASHRKSTQVHARPAQTESQVDPSFQLASTCDSVWPGL